MSVSNFPLFQKWGLKYWLFSEMLLNSVSPSWLNCVDDWMIYGKNKANTNPNKHTHVGDPFGKKTPFMKQRYYIGFIIAKICYWLLFTTNKYTECVTMQSVHDSSHFLHASIVQTRRTAPISYSLITEVNDKQWKWRQTVSHVTVCAGVAEWHVCAQTVSDALRKETDTVSTCKHD